jgi:hypothetical protein
MAATISEEYWRDLGRPMSHTVEKYWGVFQVTLDSSYPTGGEALDFTSLSDFSAVDLVVPLNSSSANGYVPQWDAANSKLLMYEAGADAAALDEVADTTDLSAETIVVMVFGTA